MNDRLRWIQHYLCMILPGKKDEILAMSEQELKELYLKTEGTNGN